jgi:hypothetical protein
LRLPVKLGELEPDETDEEYEANKAVFDAVFRAALR